MNKYIIIILAALCLGSCKSVTTCDTISFLSVFTIENKSSHNITIKTDSKDITNWETSIPNGNSYVTEIYHSDYPASVSFFVGNRCIVTFDNNIDVVHSFKISDKLIDHNLCDKSSYSIKISGKHDTKWEYTYTFTDEDYDRAVAANKESEE